MHFLRLCKSYTAPVPIIFGKKRYAGFLESVFQQEHDASLSILDIRCPFEPFHARLPNAGHLSEFSLRQP